MASACSDHLIEVVHTMEHTFAAIEVKKLDYGNFECDKCGCKADFILIGFDF